jgi:hypothetical protein
LGQRVTEVGRHQIGRVWRIDIRERSTLNRSKVGGCGRGVLPDSVPNAPDLGVLGRGIAARGNWPIAATDNNVLIRSRKESIGDEKYEDGGIRAMISAAAHDRAFEARKKETTKDCSEHVSPPRKSVRSGRLFMRSIILL